MDMGGSRDTDNRGPGLGPFGLTEAAVLLILGWDIFMIEMVSQARMYHDYLKVR